MKLRFLAVAALTIVAAAPADAAQAPRRQAAAPAAPAQTDWMNRVTLTPQGGFQRGNPAAKVKLVEFASFTCSHCAAFQAESRDGLGALIRSGQVSLELRNAIRDRFDLAAALLARCQGPGGFFRAADAIFANQPEWLSRASYFPEPTESASMADALTSIARGIGLDKIAAPDLPAARVAACIASAPEQSRLARMRDEAWNELRIPGTPAFLLNGTLVADAASWQALEPAVRAALK
ncbi:DsbA family protein [Sphingomonas quercus]|uniref:DsbA family protein n=1 Tax=Sphingomonas quercus TaxID=2842451 RepID=A0ABS6BI67_9SPHN|nr:thioredoxin domain-containing protein [Sphingomonas quercus]MBU3077993.1 DsbA family protein [Sphingomonas quercus]